MRRTPLKRKTPLRSGGARLKTRSPLRARSKSREREDRERAKAKLVVWERARGRCELASPIAQVDPAARICSGDPEFHEPKKRGRGGSIVDPENMVLACSAHHRWTEENVGLADEIGALRHSWQ